MKGRVLAVGNDQNLLLTRASVLNTRWFTSIASSQGALNLLKEKPFDILVLCHSISSKEAIALMSSVQRGFPKIRILVLEMLPGSRAHLNSCATVVSSGDPSKILDAIERLLGDASSG